MDRDSKVTIDGVEMSLGAAENVEWVGRDPAADVAALRRGRLTAKTLLARCLDGAEGADVINDWHEYVSAIVLAARLGGRTF